MRLLCLRACHRAHRVYLRVLTRDSPLQLLAETLCREGMLCHLEACSTLTLGNAVDALAAMKVPLP